MTFKKRRFCPKCGAKYIHKDGQQGGRQRYKCGECKHRFQYKKRTKKLSEELWEQYTRGKQTLTELAEKCGHSYKWVRKQLDTQQVSMSIDIPPRSTVIVPDTTFWGRHYGVVVFRSWNLKCNIWWQEVPSERVVHYYYGRKILEERGWTFTAIIVDGRRSLTTVFKDIPVQISLSSD